MPGIAASTRETWELGDPPNSVEAPENSFAREVTWACTSIPTITSQSPVAPLMSLLVAAAVIRSSSLRAEQVAGDCRPFGFERAGRGRLAGPAIPISGIAEIAFHPV